MNDLPLPLWVLVLIPLMLGLAPFLYAAFERWSDSTDKKLERADIKATEHGDRLEKRVRVLERIATDKGTAVAEEIESLRLSRD